MMSAAPFWLLCTLGCIALEALFSMAEMASISFPRLRLSLMAAQQRPFAVRLQRLLSSPARLFSTTLLGVNLGLQLGAESARQLYASLGWHPDLAPLTQVPIVIMFAELAPLFAARRCPESVARVLAPLLSVAAVLLRPFTIVMEGLTNLCNRAVSTNNPASGQLMSRDEVLRAFEDTQGSRRSLATLLLSLRQRPVRELMQPISAALVVHGSVGIGQLRALMRDKLQPFVLVSQGESSAITGVIPASRLISAEAESTAATLSIIPRFVSGNMPTLAVLRQLHLTGTPLAVVVDEQGSPEGWLSLQGLFSGQVFAENSAMAPWVERYVPGSMSVGAFNLVFQAQLDSSMDTIEDLLEHELGHPASRGDVIQLGAFQFTVEDVALAGDIKRVHVKTLS